MEAEIFWDIDKILGFVALLTGIAYVVLAAFRFRLCWIFGGLSSTFLIYTLLSAQFYVDALMNVYFLIMAFVGWRNWKISKPLSELISIDNPSRQIFSVFFILLASGIFGYLLDQFTETPYAYMDACFVILSIWATWLSTQKVLENWLYWIAANLIASSMYFAQDLYFESTLMVVYGFVAIFGYYEWRRIYKYRPHV